DPAAKPRCISRPAEIALIRLLHEISVVFGTVDDLVGHYLRRMGQEISLLQLFQPQGRGRRPLGCRRSSLRSVAKPVHFTAPLDKYSSEWKRGKYSEGCLRDGPELLGSTGSLLSPPYARKEPT